ncbi:MAG TPA: ABC transporter permease [Pyrinomonadaceae bacterium]|jgi:putative ABC transport system permease protein|nr:ABC transporter permease [Pyrinomonadaceae bacterium]
MGNLFQDLRYGARMLLKRPVFAVVALMTLALGIGANTAIFSVVNTILLRPLAFRDSGQLVAVFEKQASGARDYISYPNLQDYESRNHVFEDLSTFVPQSVNLTGTDQPDRVRGGFVSSSFFKMLGVAPAQGRVILPAEDVQGGERVVVLNHDFWQKRFGGDTKLIGRALTLNGDPYTIVGIMPESFRFPMDEVEVWMPAQYWPNYAIDRAEHNAFVLGRLKEGVLISEAQAEMAGIAAQLARAYPKENGGRGIEVVGLQSFLVEDMRPVLLILLGAVGFILLIACANIANLLLARGSARWKEIAVRAALGASRPRLIRQFLTETVLLSVAGGVLGLLLAQWGVDLLMAISPGPLPGGVSPRFDLRVLGFTLVVSVLTGLLFGVMPALQLSKPDLYSVLKEGRGTGEGTGRHRLRALFIISQVSLSVVLLVGAGLLINSFYRLLRTSPGFPPENLLTMEYRLPKNKYPKGAEQTEFHRRVVERVREVPGVQSAAVVGGLPFSGNGGTTIFTLPDRAQPEQGKEPKALVNRAGDRYFETIGIPLIKGRTFTEQDRADAPPVVIINQSMAQTYWPGEDPIGKQIHLPEAKTTASIIGVVGDAKQFELGEQQRPQIYSYFAQNPNIFATLVVRTQVEPMSLANSVRAALWSVDKDQPVWKIRTVESLLERNVASPRFMMSLMTAFAGLALLLTAIGLYGVISYSVSQRTQEIGIRMALGAQARDVLRMIVRQGMRLALIGVLIGMAASFIVTRVLSSLLYGVTATDPLTFIAAALVLGCVALLACLIPAHRATRVDPMVALRYE